jgi:hypothetical protein
MSLNLLIASQYVSGCLAFLKKARPSVIVTDYDRHSKWSCMVLVAKKLGIPVLTLVHGVMHEDAVGYSPVLADKIFCWGAFDRDKLIAAGEPEDKIVICGCPRLSRELPLNRQEARRQLGMDPSKPVVMFASTPTYQISRYIERFCSKVGKLAYISGIVRLHPSESQATYKQMIARNPEIRFMVSSDFSLDVCLAAADVVVVHDSGVGSDALVKGRLTVVFNEDSDPVGHDGDMIKYAGCPHARSPEELERILYMLVFNDEMRSRHVTSAERFVSGFCRFFGRESAGRIAEVVKETSLKSKLAELQ